MCIYNEHFSFYINYLIDDPNANVSNEKKYK